MFLDEVPLKDRLEDTEDLFGIFKEAFEGLEGGLSRGRTARRVCEAWRLPVQDAEIVVAVAFRLLKSRM